MRDRSKKRRRKTVSLDQRLSRYVLATGAAALGASTASADIVYYDYHSTSPTTPISGSLYFDFETGLISTPTVPVPPGADIHLFNAMSGSSSQMPTNEGAAAGAKFGSSVLRGGPANTAQRLGYGFVIGTAGQNFLYSLALGGVTTANNSQVFFGNFTAGQEGYIGLRFLDSASATHFAWADVILNANYTVTLLGFAYETTPGLSIKAGAIPEPSEIALFALGAAGVAAVRARRKTKAAA